ncbi:hypothetical protein FHS27_003793 [Rhodopirellula rubra]|uniref:Uncharacterized protein n=1 Tax=Aporhodopirellula rubra TaxID=980271 RepID=A0A7W5H7H3_9BACT|nr:hypothetical protein [Aporhodopirellula rubra]
MRWRNIPLVNATMCQWKTAIKAGFLDASPSARIIDLRKLAPPPTTPGKQYISLAVFP